jgi:hypothetical protein
MPRQTMAGGRRAFDDWLTSKCYDFFDNSLAETP